MPQTSISQSMTARYAGRLSTNMPHRTWSRTTLAALAFGLLALRSPADAVGTTRPPADPSAADNDAIAASGIASAAAAVTYDASTFNGAIGPGMIRPTRRITFTFNNHADWDLTVARFWGIGESGQLQSEEIHIPNSGNVVRTTALLYRRAVKLELPAQTGANGTVLIGIAAGGAATAYVADPDAICVGPLASAATAQTFGGAQFDGVLGQTMTWPAKLVTVTFNNHADWDATNMVIWGEDERGAPVSDTIVIPNGGNATVTSVKKFCRLTACHIPAQTGANGTATIGYAAEDTSAILWGTLFEHDGVAVYDGSIEQESTPAGYPDDSVVTLCTEGEIDMTSEEATIEGAQVFVRLIAGGGEVRGQVRMDDDGGDCVPVAGMFFGESRDAGAVKVRVRPAA